MTKNLITGHSNLKTKDYPGFKEACEPKVNLIVVAKRVRTKIVENPIVYSTEIEDAKQLVDSYLDR